MKGAAGGRYLIVAVFVITGALCAGCVGPLGSALTDDDVQLPATALQNDRGQGTPFPADVPWLLTEREAVDLARFRGWLVTQGAVYVPRPTEVLVGGMTLDKAKAAVREAGGQYNETRGDGTGREAGHTSSRLRVFFVVVRGPVTDSLDSGRTVSNALALVVDLRGKSHYARAGPPWDATAPQGAHAVPF